MDHVKKKYFQRFILTTEIIFDLINFEVFGGGKSHGGEDNKYLHDFSVNFN